MTTTARFTAILAAQWTNQWRLRIPQIIIGLAVPWTAVAAAAPPIAPYLLFFEVSTVGVVICGALVVADRTHGVTAALSVSPAPAVLVLLARVVPLWLMTLVAAAPVLVAGRIDDPVTASVAIAVTATFLLTMAASIAARRTTLFDFLSVIAWLLAPLVAVPLAVSVGLLAHPVGYVVPTTGALMLIRGASPYPSWLLLGYLALGAVAAVIWGARRSTAWWTVSPRARTRRTPTRGWWAYPRMDFRHISRGAVTFPVVLSPLLLGLVLQYALPPLTRWAEGVHHVDLTPYRPIIALTAIVLHVPVIAGMLGALITLDDRDDGVLSAILVSPLGARLYLVYRLALVTGFAAVGMAVAAPLSGQVPATAWPACVLAVAFAPAFALAVLAVADTRAGGVSVVKALGVPSYGPLVAWWMTGPVTWIFALSPSYWIVIAWREPQPGTTAAGVVCVAGWLALLAPRALQRITR